MVAKGASSNATAVKGRTAHSVTADSIKASVCGKLSSYLAQAYVPAPITARTPSSQPGVEGAWKVSGPLKHQPLKGAIGDVLGGIPDGLDPV
ncbi:hypothetical protein HaLaN_28710, partial [Haematococcus lacustris]